MQLTTGERKVAKTFTIIELAKGISIMAEHWPHHRKVGGLSAATDAETGREKSGEKI